MKPSRRALLVVIAVVAATLTADVALFRVFMKERDEALSSAKREIELMERAATDALYAHLRDELERRAADIARIESDPLRDELGLLLFVDGRQTLPRVRGEDRIDVEGEGADELTALANAASAASSDDAFESAVRAFLSHRANTRVAARVDAEASLRVLDALLAKGADASLVRSFVIAGMTVGTAKIEPLAATILRARAAGEWPSGDDVAARFRASCAKAGVDCAQFDRRWSAVSEARAIPLSTGLRAPIVDLAREIYVEPAVDGRALGVVLDERARADALGAIASRVLREDGDSAQIVPAVDGAGARVDVTSPRLDAAAGDAELFFRIKSALLLALTVMAAGLVAAVLLDRARRRRYDELRTGFVAAVSHELRTPLASMRLLVDSMLPKADDRARERLERLGRDVDGLDFLVENILSFSRLERGKLEPRRERASLAEVAAEGVDRARASGIHAEVHVDPESSGAFVDVDIELIALVISNLVRNAWQHNAKPNEEKRVDVRVKDREILVIDNGPGVDEADRSRIFGEFERGSRPTTRGTGLGLALCRQIARVHGGDVTLASTSTAGSTFALKL